IRSFAHSPIRPFAHSPIRPFAHSLIRPFAHSLIRPFAHSPIRSHRPRCPSCAYRQALSAPGRPASAAWRRRIA
ncbi:hypothetical protein D8O06_29105, partial [Burkholderia mallei]